MGQRPKRRRNSHLWPAALAVGLGFLTTLGFAGYGWYAIHAGAKWLGYSKSVMEHGLREGAEGRVWLWMTTRGRWFSSRIVMLSTGTTTQIRLKPGQWKDSTGRILDTSPPWADADGAIARLRSGEGQYNEIRYGVPFRSLQASVALRIEDGSRAARTLTGTDIGRRDLRTPECELAPTGPIWSGLLADTAIFGVAWLMVLEIGPAWRWVRARRRAARGLCVACAYDRAGLAPETACPECGLTPGVG